MLRLSFGVSCLLLFVICCLMFAASFVFVGWLLFVVCCLLLIAVCRLILMLMWRSLCRCVVCWRLLVALVIVADCRLLFVGD